MTDDMPPEQQELFGLAVQEAVNSRDPALLRTLIQAEIETGPPGAQTRASTVFMAQLLRADPETRQWWSDHGHDANDDD